MRRPFAGETLSDLGAMILGGHEPPAPEFMDACHRIRGVRHPTLREAHAELAAFLADAKQIRGSSRTGASI